MCNCRKVNLNWTRLSFYQISRPTLKSTISQINTTKNKEMKPDLNFSYLTKYVHGYLHEKTSITKRSRLSVALRYHNGGQNQSEDELFSRDISIRI